MEYALLSKQIFKWRTRMVNFKMNFKNGNEDLLCPLGCSQPDSQDLILKCPVLKIYLPELDSTNVQYRDIFSKKNVKIRNCVELLEKAFAKRETLIKAVATVRAQNGQDN